MRFSGRQRWGRIAAACAACVGVGVASGVVIPDDERLAELEAETRTLTAEAAGTLTGEAASAIAAALGERPIVLALWDVDDAATVRALPVLNRTVKRADGVLVAAVHAEANADEAATKASRLGTPMAVDASGDIAKLVAGIETRPVYLVIDRAGLVYEVTSEASEVQSSASRAASMTADEAASHLLKRTERLAAARAEQDGAVLVADKPAEPRSPDLLRAARAPRPDASAYAAANWPETTPANQLSASDVQGEALPKPLGSETWLTDHPGVAFEDRVLVLDFWATWCGPCLRASPKLVRLHQKYPEELLVLAIGGQGEDENTIRSYLRRKAGEPTYHHLFDANQTLARALEVRGIPHVVVVSTDGVVRWQGNPLSPAFERVVDRVVQSDPLLAQRRGN